MRGLIAVLAAAVLATGGCAASGPGAKSNDGGPDAGDPRRGGPASGAPAVSAGTQAGLVELRVGVEESLKEAFSQVEMGFEMQNPNIEVVVSYGEGGKLAGRTTAGEPLDVLAADDPATIRAVTVAAEPEVIGRVHTVALTEGPAETFVVFLRDGDGKRILIDSGLLRP